MHLLALDHLVKAAGSGRQGATLAHSAVGGFGGAVDADVVVDDEEAGDGCSNNEQEQFEGLGVVVQEEVAGDHHGHIAKATPHFHQGGQEAHHGEHPGHPKHGCNVSLGEDALVALRVHHQLVSVPGNQGNSDDGCS